MERKSKQVPSELQGKIAARPYTSSTLARFLSPRTIVLAVILILHLFNTFYLSKSDSVQLVPTESIGTATWWPCLGGLECGRITVPKNHLNLSDGNAVIAVARKKATRFPKKGSVMLNPGGPGGSGVNFLVLAAPFLAELIGDDWDLIGFDPRGVGLTTPKVKCFPDTLTQHLFLSNTIFEQGITVPNPQNLSDARNYASLVEQQRQFLALKKAQADLCADNMDTNDLRFMGTATVVRDMDFMTRLLDGPDAKINYFGGSYGSILGAYLVNMLPRRIGRATIDGIADPISWANDPSHKWHKGWVSSAEKTYKWFLDDCSKAGPELCPLTSYMGEPASTIQERIEDFIASLVDEPLAVARGPRPGYVTAGAARGILFIGLQTPRLWPVVSRALAAAMPPHSNATALFSLLVPPLSAPAGHSGAGDLARLGVTCADSPLTETVTAEELAEENLRALRDGSLHFGVSPIITEPDGGCQYWPTKGLEPERFTGPWNASLEYPLLIVSNTADPITPIASGLLVNANMPKSSTLLIQNGPGHCSFAMPSICTLKAVRAYWAGNPPLNGTVCEISAKTFPSKQGDEFRSMSAADIRLVQAGRQLNRVLTEMRRPGLSGLL